jgi:hypothetical protein
MQVSASGPGLLEQFSNFISAIPVFVLMGSFALHQALEKT